jgi:tetratricopeptide (TPR) repeat protein
LKYLQLLIAPVQVTGDYDFNSIPVAGMGDAVAWAGLLLAAAIAVLAVWMLRRQAALSFAILFFYATILPTSNWIMPTAIVMSERALYLPSLGICLVAGILWSKLQSRQIQALLAVGVMVTAAVLCIAHNYVWRDELTYYGNLVRVLPDNVRGRQGYGVALVESGRPHEALEQFEAGLKIRRDAPSLVGLGDALMQIDRNCGRARQVLEEAMKIQPADPFAPWLLGGCLEQQGLVKEAEASYRKAIDNTRFPDPKLLADWGRALERTGRPSEAQEAYRRAALLN